ncbi:MAG: hypothetical protein H7227_01400 [Actinobacteria bacterium]|nr:hypothetical protein [Actinomycetota bacterium]
MKKGLIVVALASALALTGCAGAKKEATSNGNNDDLVTGTTSTTGAGFDKPLDLGAGITVTISAPKTFTPGNFASSYLPGQVANVLAVEIKNSGSTEIDPTSISFASDSGDNTCTDVLDGDNGVSGAPTDPIAAGTTASFKIAVGCDAKAGAPLRVSINIGASSVAVDGKIA